MIDSMALPPKAGSFPLVLMTVQVPSVSIPIFPRGRLAGASLSQLSEPIFQKTDERLTYHHRSLPQSSSASRFTAGASGFLNFSQSFNLPDR
jgi:hypothetical protein